MNIEKFEIKINSLKKRVNKKILGIIYFGIFTILIIFSLEMSKTFKKQKDLLETEYNRSMYEMIGYIKNINLQFNKLQITNDTSTAITGFADVWRQSNLAKENLSNLPISQTVLSSTEKFLGQVSDYSYSLMKTMLKTDNLNSINKEEIKNISNSSKELFNITSLIFDEFNKGKISWDKAENIGSENLEKVTLWSNIEKMDQIFQDYEGLIYDGAFSEHIENIEPKFLKDKEVSIEEAKQKIIDIFKENIKNIEYIGEINNKFSLYNFNVMFNNELIKNIQISKKGAKIYSIISNKEVNDINITNDGAIKIGKEFLEKLNIKNMESTYYYIYEGLITINYAYKQDNTIIYPDLIKIKISLDNGEICMLETAGYMYNHEERKNINTNLDLDKVRNIINRNVDILNVKLALIPTDSKDEILCYEVEGQINENKCLIYINSKTFKEEKILMLIETPDGTLTM